MMTTDTRAQWRWLADTYFTVVEQASTTTLRLEERMPEEQLRRAFGEIAALAGARRKALPGPADGPGGEDPT